MGPVSVGIDARGFWFRFYSHGVYEGTFCSSHRLNHGVLVVGYGSEDNNDYWLVKNRYLHWYTLKVMRKMLNSVAWPGFDRGGV